MNPRNDSVPVAKSAQPGPALSERLTGGPHALRNKSDLRAAFKEYNIWTRKELGQNFLIDHNLLRFLVETGEVGPDDLLLDIGAGTGLLTRHLAERAWQVWGIEIDHRLFDFCNVYTTGLMNVRLFHQDVLKDKYHLDPALESSLKAEAASRPRVSLKVVSNLPYSISTLIIPVLLESPLPLKLMVLTVQREVGERLVASPATKEYGSLSVIVQARANVRIARIMPHTVFWPQPKVDSAIVRIEPTGERLARIRDPRWFNEVTRGLFSARRKMAINALKQDEKLRLPAQKIEAALRHLGIDPQERGERLSVDQIIDLSNELGGVGPVEPQAPPGS